MRTPEYMPGYLDEATALLGTPFFYDEARQIAQAEEPELLAMEELGARRSAYIGALTMIGQSRSDERHMSKPVDTTAWNDAWRLTHKRLDTIAVQHDEEVRVHARRLIMLNNLERRLAEGSAHAGLLDHQTPYLEGILTGLQKGPQRVNLPEWWGRREAGAPAKERPGDTFYLPGVIMHGPTGIGKSAIASRLAVGLGIGSVPVTERHPASVSDPLRFLMIEPSQALIATMLGHVGSGIFGKLAPGLQLGSEYQGHHATPNDHVIFTTIDTFINKFRDGKLNGIPIDCVGIDEAHRITEPEFLRIFLRNWNGLTIGFSATPSYRPGKDARDILRHEVRQEDILAYADKGILSHLTLYSLIVQPKDIKFGQDISDLPAPERQKLRQKATSETARDVAQSLIAEGRRGIIFCEPGGDSRHARDTAALLDGLELPDGRTIRSGAIGSFQGKSNTDENAKLLRQFDAGDIDVLTSVVMGQEGLHLHEVHFVIVACKITSRLKLQQMGGRALSRSHRFENAILININTLGFGQEQYYAQTFVGLFGGDTIQQGQTIRMQNQSTPARQRQSTAAGPSQPIFSDHIQHLLERIDRRTIAEAYLYDNKTVEVPPGYVQLETIIGGKQITPYAARQQLLRAGYRFIGVTERDTKGNATFVRYYEPTASTYFTPNPEPPKDGAQLQRLVAYTETDECISLPEIAARLHIHPKVLKRRYLLKAELTASQTLRRVGQPAGWAKAEGEKIISRLEALLIFPAHLISLSHACSCLEKRAKTAKAWVSDNEDLLGVEPVQRGNRIYPGLPWSALKILIERYGLKPGCKPINYKLLPSGPDATPEQIDYARQVQRDLGMPNNWLPALPASEPVDSPILSPSE